MSNKHEFKWLEGVKSAVGIEGLGRVYKWELIPLSADEKARLDTYGDEYAG